MLLLSCGGGSGSGGAGGFTAPAFSVTVAPQSLTLRQGESGGLALTVTPVGGFNQSIQVSLSGLPDGVTSSPTSPFTMGLSGQSITLKASSTAALGSQTITIHCSSGTLSSQMGFSLTVNAALPQAPNDRTSFVRTDDTPLSIVYDPVHGRIFASAEHLNCVDVIALATHQVLRCVPVSGATGLSLSADGTQVLVGTEMGEVDWIDTTSLQVVKRGIVPQIPATNGFLLGATYVPAAQAYQAANGKILIFAFYGYEDFYGDFNPSSVVEWDPASGTAVPRPDAGSGGLVSMSADHSKILIGGQGTATLYDSATDQFTAVPGMGGGVYEPAMSPSGNQFALIDGNPLIQFFNGQMQPVGSVDLTLSSAQRPAGAVYSADGKYLYVVLRNYFPILVTIDTSTFQVVGTAPAYSSQIAYFSVPRIVGIPQAADSTGLVFEMADHGVAINDATNLHDYSNPDAVSDFIIATPDEGPLGGAATQMTTHTFGTVPNCYFGTQPGINPHLNAVGQLACTAPPAATAGPVDIKALLSNQTEAFIPQGFTYGTLPIQYGVLASGPAGGVPADFFGYGFSVDVPGADLQVKVGSSAAGVESRDLYPGENAYPFPLQHLTVEVPPGSPGAKDVTVTSPTGTASYARGFHYLQSVNDYPSADQFSFVLYDSHRNQVYLSAGDHIDVFSLATHTYSTPISVPSIGGSRLILGLALTPDGSKLLAANQSDQSVAIINPDNPASGAVAVSLPLTGMGAIGPDEIATTSTNQAFVTLTAVSNGYYYGTPVIYDIDLSSLQVTTAFAPTPPVGSVYAGWMQGSADGKEVVVAIPGSTGGTLLSWQADTGEWEFRSLSDQFWLDVAISGDGNVLAADPDAFLSDFPFPILLDPDLHAIARANFPEFQSLEMGPSIQLDQSGALLYALCVGGFEIVDARTGQLRERMILSEPILSGPVGALPGPLKAMAITPAGNQVFLSTTSGLAVADMDSVPLGIGSVTPASGPAGSVVTVRGAGFASGTTVSVNGVSASASRVDSSTLTVTIPSSLQPGPAQFILSNPVASKLTVDAAFLVQ